MVSCLACAHDACGICDAGEPAGAQGSRVMALYTVSQQGLPVYDGIYPVLQGEKNVYIQVFEHGKDP